MKRCIEANQRARYPADAPPHSFWRVLFRRLVGGWCFAVSLHLAVAGTPSTCSTTSGATCTPRSQKSTKTTLACTRTSRCAPHPRHRPLQHQRPAPRAPTPHTALATADDAPVLPERARLKPQRVGRPRRRGWLTPCAENEPPPPPPTVAPTRVPTVHAIETSPPPYAAGRRRQ